MTSTADRPPGHGRRAVILAGGWAHEAADPVLALEPLLTGRGFEPVVVTDARSVPAAVAAGCDLLVVCACWFSMADERYTPDQRSRWAVPPDAEREAALLKLADAGTPVLAVHAAVISFDGWEPWTEWLGGGWNHSTSSHPPPTEITVVPEPGSPIPVDGFSVIDEEYRGLDIDGSVQIVARSATGHPMAWLRAGDRRAAVSVLGHDARSLRNPGHRRLLNGMLDWLLADPRTVSEGTNHG